MPDAIHIFSDEDIEKEGDEGVANAFLSSFPDLQHAVHQNAVLKGFFDTFDKEDLEGIGNRLMLIVGEASEAHEGIRRRGLVAACEKPIDILEIEEELADIVIRVMDLAEALGLQLGRAIILKHLYNATRPQKHGLKF